MVLLALASPIILLLVAIVRCTSPGPGLYRQTRTGKDGIEFGMYKIRTMYQDAEAVSGPTWCKPGDSRITPVGRILRLLHLDELPQLINIVKGDMDLVGPRPERPAFVEMLAREIPHYRDRLQVLPGVTGLAQVNLPPDETINCVRKKLVLDRDYIRTACLNLDVRILICTSLRMLGIRHGRAVRWLHLERHVNVPTTRYQALRPAAHRNGHPAARPVETVCAAVDGIGASVATNGDMEVEDTYAATAVGTAAASYATRRPR